MKGLFLLFAILIFQGPVFGQYTYAGKTFIDQKLNQIDFLDDTVLLASFMMGKNRYEFQNGRLNLKLPHKLEYYSKDSFCLTYSNAATQEYDTMIFVNIQKYQISIDNFDSLRLDMFGTMAPNKRVIIRRDKTVLFADNEEMFPGVESVDYQKLVLPEKEYRKFLDTLGKSLVFLLPLNRGNAAFDPTYYDFTIHTNGRTIISKGSLLSKKHSQLVSYLLNIIPKVAIPIN